MLKKITLLILFVCIVSSGFAQKSKKKNSPSPPKNSYFEITVNGSTTIQDLYCPNVPLEFNFNILDTTISELIFCWVSSYHKDPICDIKPLDLTFPSTEEDPPYISSYKVSLTFFSPVDSIIVSDTIPINIGFSRYEEVIEVCQGKKITISTLTHGDITFDDIQENICTPWDTLKFQSVYGCDSLVRWCIKMKPYETKEYFISSCDSVIWGDIIVKPTGVFVDNKYETDVYRLFPNTNQDPCCECDTLIKLSITIIDTGQLVLTFDQVAFCSGDDMGGTIELETYFTAFDWTYLDTDSTWTVLRDKSIEVTLPGIYYVLAYMDTSLYDTLKDLRIVNCSKAAIDTVEDCSLIIPNVITPNGDGINDVFGIKKLNPVRENELTIYDRWGKSVFNQRNYKCIYRDKGFQNIEGAFEGKSRGGQDLPEGTYYYAFKYNAFPDKNKKTYTGTLLIIR